jgi:hypothetical protein
LFLLSLVLPGVALSFAGTFRERERERERVPLIRLGPEQRATQKIVGGCRGNNLAAASLYILLLFV